MPNLLLHSYLDFRLPSVGSLERLDQLGKNNPLVYKSLNLRRSKDFDF
jgi:hypothetical protein